MGYKRKCCYGLLFMVMLCCSFTVWGAEKSTIKVGLESVYKDVAAISLSSDVPMTFGYYDERGFSLLGILDSQSITIKKAVNAYQEVGSIYANYQAALEDAKALGGVPVCLDENLYSIYKEAPGGSASVNDCYVVSNNQGEALFVFRKGSKDIVFQGYDNASGLSLTKVGSTKKYRGAIGMGGTTGITPYNVLKMEEYLYGVIPGEMSASWPQEALKAQSVAARSIAIFQYNRYLSRGYNVLDTTATQVYGGYTKEDPRTNVAVDATTGQTIKYNGQVAEALYFSTSGGMTETATNVWGTNIPYLQGVSDSYETEPAQAPWTRNFTMADIDACLAAQGANIGSAQGLQVVSRTSSGRVQELKVLGTVGSYSLTLEKIRTFFSSAPGGSLRSRLFNFQGVGQGGSSTVAKKVTVLSASGTMEVAANNLVATNGSGNTPLTGSAVVQSANGVTTLDLTSQQVSNNTSETVWGNFTIQGQGYGHGVGMSQSGAKGMAKAGFNYIQILQHYYTGITVE